MSRLFYSLFDCVFFASCSFIFQSSEERTVDLKCLKWKMVDIQQAILALEFHFT